MSGVVTRAGLFSAAAFAAMLGVGAAYAGPTSIVVGPPSSPQIVAFNSLSNPINHDEGIVTFGGGELAASFTMPSGNAIQALGLDLSCDGQFGVSNTCAPGAYSSAFDQVVFNTGASAGSNQLTLVNDPAAAGIKVGAFIQGGGPGGILANTIYVTGINGNTLTLSQPLTAAQAADVRSNGSSGRAIVWTQPLGSFMVYLVAGNVAGIPNLTAANSTSIPNSNVVASFPVYDAALYALDTAVATGSNNKSYVDYTFNLPFGNLDLTAGASYWIELTDTSALDSVPSYIGWAILTGKAGAGVAGEYWYATTYVCTSPSPTHACSQGDGLNSQQIPDSVFGMEVTTPEPGTLAILGSALLGVGLIRRRRRSMR